jgi:hypothetical protein
VARRRYGGVIGLEWLYPKALEVYDEDRTVFDMMDVCGMLLPFKSCAPVRVRLECLLDLLYS